MTECNFHLGKESLPLMAFAIHNGHRLPADLLPFMGIDEATCLREEDPYTGEFASCFANHATVFCSRFAIDLNRNLEGCVYQIPEDAWGLPVRKAPLNDEMLKKLREDYLAWYRYVAYHLEKMLATHPRLLVLDLHSYNHRRGGPEAAPDPQINNPDIIIGRNILPENLYPIVEELRKRLDGHTFQDKALDCRCDVKFSGGHFSRWINSKYAGRAICLAIEFKKIFMNEWTGIRDPHAFEELKYLFFNAVMDWLPAFLNSTLDTHPSR